MIMLRKGFFCFLFLVCDSLYAANANALLTEDAMRLTLNREGFQTLAGILNEGALKDIHDQPIADFEQGLDSGVQGSFSGVRYSLDFGKVEINPGPEGLQLEVDIHQIKVSIDRARFYKRIIFMISTTCLDTEAVIGGTGPIPLKVLLQPSVNEGRIAIAMKDADLAMVPDQFQVTGPRQCSGALGIGNLIKGAIHKALLKTRETIRDRIEEALQTAGPALAASINPVFDKPYSLGVSSIPGMPRQNILLKLRPFAVELNNARLRIALSADIVTEPAQVRFRPLLQQKASAAALALGSLGMKAALLNDAMEKLWPRLPTTIDIDLTKDSVLREIFSRQSLSMILPDLNLVVLDSEIIHARIGVGQTPQFSFTSGPQGEAILGLDMPDLRLMLEIEQKGQRRPYFDLVFQLSLQLEPLISSDMIKLQPLPAAVIRVDGQWAKGYAPKLDFFEKDVAQIVFARALDILVLSGPLAQFEIPAIQISPETELKVSRPHVEDGFFGADLVNAQREASDPERQ